MVGQSGQIDRFALDNLPAKEHWPVIFNSLPELNYPERLNAATELLDSVIRDGQGARTLFYFGQEIWSYADLFATSNQIANFLVDDLGLVPGNRVLIHGPNTPLLAACWFAVLKAGGICVTTMPLLRSAEIGYIVGKAKIALALSDFSALAEVNKVVEQNSDLKQIVPFNWSDPSSLENKVKSKSTEFGNVLTSSEDVALIAFTSGTTGKSKATVHNHRDILAICDCFPRHILKPNAEDIFIGTPPFAFTFGLGALVLFPIRVRASCVLCAKPNFEEILRLIELHQVTILFTSPTGYRSMVDLLPRFKIDSLTKCVSAGEVLPSPTFFAWQKATGIKIMDGIGATEMLHIFISAAGDDIKPGSTGRVVPGYEAAVFDGNGKSVPPNTVGFLAVRGPTGCRYLDDLERQREYVRFGWNFTGDAYLMDEDGYFYFHARADDMIISSGYNISGIEVENVLLSHPCVKECGVVAAPDELRGNIVKAFVVLRDGTESGANTIAALQEYVKAQIAPYKYPRQIEFVPSLPRTETGKLQRFRLRQGEQSGAR